jgi:type II secretory pathway pseudopilin PulG
MWRRKRLDDDRGETLVELLVTVVILGTAVVAIVAALGTAIRVSDIHRKQANAGAYLRAYAEALETYVAKNPSGYQPCPVGAAYDGKLTIVAPDDVRFDQPSVVSVEYWTGTAWQSACPASDVGVQRVKLQVRSQDGRVDETLTVVLRKPCRAVDTACA